MGLFSAIVGVTVEVAKTPFKLVADVVMMPVDTEPGRGPLHRTIEAIEQIKEEAEKADE